MTAPVRRKPMAPDEPGRSPFGEFLAAHRAGLGALAVIAAATAGGWWLWFELAPWIQRHPDAVLLPDAIDLVGQAAWVRADIKAEALRNASLDQPLPLDDPELQRRLARAFDIHPWVRQVVRVELRQPAAATVEIRCREPVAMVAVPGGLLAVDAEGVVLPSADFTAASAAAFPRLTGVTSSARGAEGSPWGDPLVEEGAAVAAAVGPEWKQLGLRECRPVGDGPQRRWELVAEDGRRILFGTPPGREPAGEPSAAAKLARLRQGLPPRDDAAADERLDLTLPPPDGTPEPKPIPK
jgi:hypothetical protein